MYQFERRLGHAVMALDYMKKEKDNPERDIFDHHFESCIIFARSITWIMQKELSKQSGFSEWYSLKENEMKLKGFDDFVTKRNEIEKEGKIIAKEYTYKVTFTRGAEESPGLQHVGESTMPNGERKVLWGKKEYIPRFGGEDQREVISTVYEYLHYMECLVNEAKEKFPENLG